MKFLIKDLHVESVSRHCWRNRGVVLCIAKIVYFTVYNERVWIFEQVSAQAFFMSSNDSMISLFLCSIWRRMFSQLRWPKIVINTWCWWLMLGNVNKQLTWLLLRAAAMTTKNNITTQKKLLKNHWSQQRSGLNDTNGIKLSWSWLNKSKSLSCKPAWQLQDC